jgi:hypothetical protein
MKPKCPVCGKEMILFTFDVKDDDGWDWEIRGYDFDCECIDIWKEQVDNFDCLDGEQ